MDKDLVNNQIVLMRKIVRNVKRFVKQKLHKQIKILEKRLKKQIEKDIKKLESKISNKKKELIAINGVNVDEVSKQSLINTKKYFEDIIKTSQSSVESKALARIAISPNVERIVKQFKDENPNCDEWLPSQIELWQQKKLIKKNKILKKKGLITDNDQNNEENNEESEQLDDETQQKSQKSNENDSKIIKSLPKKNIVKEKKVLKKEKTDETTIETNISSNKAQSNTTEVKTEEKKPKLDPFFLSKDSDLNEETDDNSDNDQMKTSPKQGLRRENFKPNEKKSKFSKISAKSHNLKQNKNSFKPKRFETKASNRGKSVSGEDLHPSWAAKRKDKIKIDLNERPLGKKIKFTD